MRSGGEDYTPGLARKGSPLSTPVCRQHTHKDTHTDMQSYQDNKKGHMGRSLSLRVP